jgi:hypothetical protein
MFSTRRIGGERHWAAPSRFKVPALTFSITDAVNLLPKSARSSRQASNHILPGSNRDGHLGLMMRETLCALVRVEVDGLRSCEALDANAVSCSYERHYVCSTSSFRQGSYRNHHILPTHVFRCSLGPPSMDDLGLLTLANPTDPIAECLHLLFSIFD